MLKQADFFQNFAGINLTDSPFFVKDGQATAGYNYDYAKTGAFTKILGISKQNAVADAQLNSLGFGVLKSTTSTTKTVVRAAGTKIQTCDSSSGATTNIAKDTALAPTDFFTSGSTQQVVFQQFSTGSYDTLWMTGGGISNPAGYVTYTTNGEYSFVTSGAGSGLFVTSNVVSFTLNGRSYSIPFLTNNITTLTNVATAIAADQDVLSAVISDNLHTIIVTSRNAATIAISSATVTGGATQPTITVTQLIAPVSTAVTKVTSNGVVAPTGTFTAVNSGSGTGGAWGSATGNYYYALALRKKSTQALSNCSLDVLVAIATATDSVLLTFPTGIDTTLYDKWYVYRSSVGGVTAFTAGTLVAQVNTTTATFTDTNISLATSQNIPRSGNGLLDNSPLPTQTYKCISTFKRHLAVAYNNTVCISDLNKPESWPLGLQITVPSDGPIKALCTVGSYSTINGTTDEFLVVFTEREMWVISGTVVYSSTTALWDVSLVFLDSVGCVAQSLVVRAGGYIAWIDSRGVYMWNGTFKPIYASRLIEAGFGPDGAFDKSKLSLGWGYFYRKKNQIIWTISDRTKGENKIRLKLDLRLTAPSTKENYISNVIDGIFSQDYYTTALYAGTTYIDSTNNEIALSGDNSGFIYQDYAATADNGSGIQFNYTTKAFDMGLPTISKQFNKVVVWIDAGVAKDLTLKYWAGYKTQTQDQTLIRQHMDLKTSQPAALWDIAIWDTSLWDSYTNRLTPLVYNLASPQNNCEGDSLMLDFSQTEASAPVTIHGFSVFYQESGLRK